MQEPDAPLQLAHARRLLRGRAGGFRGVGRAGRGAGRGGNSDLSTRDTIILAVGVTIFLFIAAYVYYRFVYSKRRRPRRNARDAARGHLPTPQVDQRPTQGGLVPPGRNAETTVTGYPQPPGAPAGFPPHASVPEGYPPYATSGPATPPRPLIS